jgi:hypothetical protein
MLWLLPPINAGTETAEALRTERDLDRVGDRVERQLRRAAVAVR